MAETTMEAIKKKMQAMRLEKESAFDRADHLEHRLLEQRYIYDKVQCTATAAAAGEAPSSFHTKSGLMLQHQ